VYRSSDLRSVIDAVKDRLGYTLIDLFNLERPIIQLQLEPLLTNADETDFNGYWIKAQTYIALGNSCMYLHV
jgi:hypothetical protein